MGYYRNEFDKKYRAFIEYFGLTDNQDEDYKNLVWQECQEFSKTYTLNNYSMILNEDFGIYMAIKNVRPEKTGKYVTVYKQV